MIRSAATRGLAWTYKQVQVREILPAKRIALCVDTEGLYVEVSTLFRRSDAAPAVGQIWIVDRELGGWAFAARVDIAPPDATGGQWTPLVLKNGWVVSAGAGDPAPQARLSDGWIELSGVISGGTVPALGLDLVAASLPEGFPARLRGNAVLASALPGTNGYIRGALAVNGDVTIRVSATYAPAWIDLTGLKARVT
ncbi:hypothetical protein QFZ75_007910 [Streptomyces sp. V3I8]|uniref:hypothetical protein n=1 Tax=Streptomyces sp. V3I8 TaxID=3042279 RepID=UPI00278191E8|nr:hypothetical protein [Streptomyces sp. V3I8]MDQ1041408.1 hypothetical protein [Streptomyces sp. V3I8]